MLEFTGKDWYRVKGRGFCIAVNEQPDGMWNPSDLVGEIVKINGEMFTIKGVEKFLIGISPENPYRLQFSLMVRELS